MDRVLIESPNAVADCKRAMKSVYALGYLNNFDWGCMSGVHIALATIEAENETQALWAVTPFLRSKARAIRLVKYDPRNDC